MLYETISVKYGSNAAMSKDIAKVTMRDEASTSRSYSDLMKVRINRK